MSLKCCSLAVFLVLSSINLAAENVEISHYQTHARYEYGAKVLKLALSKLPGTYSLNSPELSEALNEARGELEVIDGRIDLQWMSTSIFREENMIPIKIPIYQGLLGLRLLLINKIHDTGLEKISSIEDLRSFKGGHGLHWGDLPVYAANNLPVLAHKDYESIFKLLKLQRIDYFHRGLNEIWSELKQHQDKLIIADNVMLFYPLPVYFFVSKHRPELALLLEKGLNIALTDGSFKQLFHELFQTNIENAKLSTRQLIILKNPTLPSDTPYIETNWWLPEQFHPQMKNAF